jgi:hypothetical protein
MNLLKAFVWIRIAVGLVLAALGAAQLVIFIVWLWRCEPHNLDRLRGLPGAYQVRYHFGQISCNDAGCSTGLMVDILDRDDTRQFG